MTAFNKISQDLTRWASNQTATVQCCAWLCFVCYPLSGLLSTTRPSVRTRMCLTAQVYYLFCIHLEVHGSKKVHGGSTQTPQPTPEDDRARGRVPSSVKGKGSAARIQVGSEHCKEMRPFCIYNMNEAAECKALIPLDEKKREVLLMCSMRAHDERVQELVSALREVWPASHHVIL